MELMKWIESSKCNNNQTNNNNDENGKDATSINTIWQGYCGVYMFGSDANPLGMIGHDKMEWLKNKDDEGANASTTTSSSIEECIVHFASTLNHAMGVTASGRLLMARMKEGLSKMEWDEGVVPRGLVGFDFTFHFGLDCDLH